MAVGIAGAMIYYGTTGELVIQELQFGSFHNWHHNPTENLLFPMMFIVISWFIVISCGALSGFHFTQAPMMARCIKKESKGRHVLYGAMIAEEIVAIIRATAAMNFFGTADDLNKTILTDGYNPAWVVNENSRSWLGGVGSFFAIIGVVVCPATIGDTAFRSA
jgi:carbon starvation protein CstA